MLADPSVALRRFGSVSFLVYGFDKVCQFQDRRLVKLLAQDLETDGQSVRIVATADADSWDSSEVCTRNVDI